MLYNILNTKIFYKKIKITSMNVKMNRVEKNHNYKMKKPLKILKIVASWFLWKKNLCE